MINRNCISLSTGKYLQKPITQTVGLAQGDKLSPLLFAIFIADLSDTLLATPNQPMIIFYADDLAIGTQDLSSLQENLNILHKYCRINRNMRFYKGGGLRKKPIICYGKEPIEFVNEFVYLGIKFQTSPKTTKHLKHLVTKAKIATNSLTTKLDLNKFSLISATRLFNNFIIPAATYGHHIFKDVMSAEVWDNHIRQIYSILFKKWAAIPSRLPTMPLIDAIFGPHPLKIAERQPRTRAVIAMYYSNGCATTSYVSTEIVSLPTKEDCPVSVFLP